MENISMDLFIYTIIIVYMTKYSENNAKLCVKRLNFYL